MSCGPHQSSIAWLALNIVPTSVFSSAGQSFAAPSGVDSQLNAAIKAAISPAGWVSAFGRMRFLEGDRPVFTAAGLSTGGSATPVTRRPHLGLLFKGRGRLDDPPGTL